MKTKLQVGVFALTIAFGSLSLDAQALAQPGQIAPRPAVTNSDSSQPIQISATGELAGSPLRQSRPSGIAADPGERRSATLWKASIAALVSASAYDAVSSWGKIETNPLLRSSDGTFGAKGVAIKAALAGASIAPQIFFRNRRDLRRVFTIVNFADAALFAAIATHNLGIKPVGH